MKIGDVVIPVGDYRLVSGCGRYSHAIVVSIDPLILVSEQGDMLWRATVTAGNVMSLCQAHPSIVARAKARLRRDEWSERLGHLRNLVRCLTWRA